MSKKGKLIVFSAPSGAGKSTIVNHLLAQEDLPLAFSISATSRKPRKGEIDGNHYYFISTDEFKTKIKNGDFLEWEEVYDGLFYGTLKSEVERIQQTGSHVIFDIDVVGGLNIKKQFPEQTLAVFVSPPSIAELENRLRKRNTESEEKINMRIAKAEKEMAFASQFDYIVENHHLDTALAEAYSVVKNFIEK
jgi:guanylate kinase